MNRVFEPIEPAYQSACGIALLAMDSTGNR